MNRVAGYFTRKTKTWYSHCKRRRCELGGRVGASSQFPHGVVSQQLILALLICPIQRFKSDNMQIIDYKIHGPHEFSARVEAEVRNI
ncbi:hypothetical protein TNCT_171901 [Trichonephila clavata]|uniref:Uncharacterized protein n=1 Tax=Trichonephila clavata TaxID=2740835 RepID=A0A8X6GGG2_TRICU|nr:hypothetical protein TNCT_171901 [Trichonephila clavata]